MMSPRSPLLLAVAALWLLLIGMEIARPHYFLHDDNATFFVGAYAHDFRVLTETGRVAEVNYFQYGGEPFLEQGQTAVLYPPVYLGVALAEWGCGDLRWSIDWLAAIHLTIGLLGFYFWLRAGGVSAELAALGGLAWVLNPFVLIVASSWIMVTYAAAWLPWLFWAKDRLFAQPSARSAIYLGAIAGLFFLQGYVQWAVYAYMFLGFYALFGFVRKDGPGAISRPVIAYYLLMAALVFLIVALPLALPMSHAADVSNARARPMDAGHSLFFRVTRDDLLPAQFGFFHPQFVFGISTAMLYCPALLFLPVMAIRFFHAGNAIRQKLFPLILLALFAVFLSTRWHVLLTTWPITDRFRWPFKVFLLADFFLLASLVWTVFSWNSTRAKTLAAACVGVVLAAELAVSIGCHDDNFFSPATLPFVQRPLPAGVDPGLGRVIAFDDVVPETESARFLILGHATFFEVPSLGGYNPLVSPERLRFALGLDFPNVYRTPVTPLLRAQLDTLSVRYWIIDPHSPQLAQAQALGDFTTLVSEPDRVVLEDSRAQPLANPARIPGQPWKPCPIIYAGNSIEVDLRGANSPVGVSVEATDGWWCRIDRGAWERPVYLGNRLKIDFPPGSQVLEISYFDPRFRQGLRWSALLLVVLGILLLAENRIPKTRPTS